MLNKKTAGRRMEERVEGKKKKEICEETRWRKEERCDEKEGSQEDTKEEKRGERKE